MSVNSSATINTEDIYDYIDVFFQKKYVFLVIIVIITIYILSTIMTPKPSYSNNYLEKPKSSDGGWIVSTFIIIFIIGLIILGVLRFFFGVNVFINFKNFFKKEIELVGEIPGASGIHLPEIIPEFLSTSQVFNIPGNNYTYQNAQDLCKAYGAELADYSQMETAYNRGADWCNYGWSKDQLALFPTQKETYNKLQKIKGHENDCGRPGVNGGYMANPYNRYGVNCYGKKPSINDEEKILMNIKKTEDVQIDEKVEYWKTKIPDILISPFNSNNWSKL